MRFYRIATFSKQIKDQLFNRNDSIELIIAIELVVFLRLVEPRV